MESTGINSEYQAPQEQQELDIKTAGNPSHTNQIRFLTQSELATVDYHTDSDNYRTRAPITVSIETLDSTRRFVDVETGQIDRYVVFDKTLVGHRMRKYQNVESEPVDRDFSRLTPLLPEFRKARDLVHRRSNDGQTLDIVIKAIQAAE